MQQGLVMNKALFEYSKNLLLKYRQGHIVKLIKSASLLNQEYGFGTIQHDYLHFTDDDRASLLTIVKKELGVDLLSDDYPSPQSRIENAKTQRNEKHNALAVSTDFVLINSLQTLNINQQQLTNTSCTTLGLYIKANEIKSIEHQQIVLVENFAVMANLKLLNLPKSLHGALWLYRGDIKKQQQTGIAYQFFRRFKDSHQLICFSDFDPEGIKIALTCNASYWLTLKYTADINELRLFGDEGEWDKQINSISYLRAKLNLADECQQAFDYMQSNRNTLKQEHMLAKSLALAVYPLF
jgi:hypothetical protein